MATRRSIFAAGLPGASPAASLAPAARAGILSSVKSAVHKVGEASHDTDISLGKEVSKTADTVTQEIVNGGAVVGHTAVAAAGYVVEKGELLLAEPKAIPMPGDFPPAAASKSAAQRLADCQAAHEPDCYAKVSIPTTADIATNCHCGWSVGEGHPSSHFNPPSYDKQLNALDPCALFHDRGAWQFNRNTRVCETCVPKLYPDWGAQFATDSKGEPWLSAQSIAELRGARKVCPSHHGMQHPGFTGL